MTHEYYYGALSFTMIIIINAILYAGTIFSIKKLMNSDVRRNACLSILLWDFL